MSPQTARPSSEHPAVGGDVVQTPHTPLQQLRPVAHGPICVILIKQLPISLFYHLIVIVAGGSGLESGVCEAVPGARRGRAIQVTSDNLAHFIDTTVFLEILNELPYAPPNHYLELYWTQQAGLSNMTPHTMI